MSASTVRRRPAAPWRHPLCAVAGQHSHPLRLRHPLAGERASEIAHGSGDCGRWRVKAPQECRPLVVFPTVVALRSVFEDLMAAPRLGSGALESVDQLGPSCARTQPQLLAPPVVDVAHRVAVASAAPAVFGRARNDSGSCDRWLPKPTSPKAAGQRVAVREARDQRGASPCARLGAVRSGRIVATAPRAPTDGRSSSTGLPSHLPTSSSSTPSLGKQASRR